MKIDKKIFADKIRPFFGGSIRQPVWAGISDLLDAVEEYGDPNPDYAGYIFGGVRWETGSLMYPVREGFAKTDKGARQVVRHKRYGKPAGPYGLVYYGRGRIQNTWLKNMTKLSKRFGYDLVKDPDHLLDSVFDARVTVVGHHEGIWTGKKLSHFNKKDGFDFTNARTIVNSHDHAADIAKMAKDFARAFRLAISEDAPYNTP